MKMHTTWWKLVKAFFVLTVSAAFLVAMSGCLDDDGSGVKNIAGSWLMEAEDGDTTDEYAATLDVSQSGSTFSGTAVGLNFNGSFSGQLNGNSVSLTLVNTDATNIVWTMTGDLTDLLNMSGTYDSTTTGEGTWTMVKLP